MGQLQLCSLNDTKILQVLCKTSILFVYDIFTAVHL